MIKNAEEFQELTTDQQQLYVAVSFLSLVSFIVSVISLAVFLNTTLFIISFMAFFGFGMALFLKDEARMKNALKQYRDYLRTVEVEDLILLSRSQEISYRSKEAVVSFLNEKHPGWSLRHNK